MNKKGQALVEFIIIMPVLILLLIAIVDYARILSKRSELESMMEDVIMVSDYNVPTNVLLNEAQLDGKKIYSLRENIDIYSPFLTIVINSPYAVEVTRTVYE